MAIREYMDIVDTAPGHFPRDAAIRGYLDQAVTALEEDGVLGLGGEAQGKQGSNKD